MALANYSDLVTAIQAWMMDRGDLATPAADFIALGEGLINYGAEPQLKPLRCRDMESLVTLTPASGICALPTDYLQYRRVVEKSTPRRELEYIAPAAAEQMYASRAAGLANHFTIVGQNLYSFPLASNPIELTYYQAVPALSSGAPTNWLMTKHPGIYLRAALMQAAEYIKNDVELAKQAMLLGSLVAAVNGADQMASLAKAGATFRRKIR